MDLVVGREEGDLKHYYENTGNAKNPAYTRREGAANPFDGVEDVGYYSSPAFVDVDGDGDADLLFADDSSTEYNEIFYNERGKMDGVRWTE